MPGEQPLSLPTSFHRSYQFPFRAHEGIPESQHPAGTAGPLVTPTASFIPVFGNRFCWAARFPPALSPEERENYPQMVENSKTLAFDKTARAYSVPA